MFGWVAFLTCLTPLYVSMTPSFGCLILLRTMCRVGLDGPKPAIPMEDHELMLRLYRVFLGSSSPSIGPSAGPAPAGIFFLLFFHIPAHAIHCTAV